MDDILYCNIPNCGAPLENNAWVTTCKHIFCMKHGTEHFHSKSPQFDCPVCDEKLVREKEVKICSSNVNKLCLAGLRPEKILSLLEFSMKLWKRQLGSQRTVDNARIQNLAKQVEETEEKYKRIMYSREADLNRQIETLQSKYRHLAMKLKQKMHELELTKTSVKEAMAMNNARQRSPALSRQSVSTPSLFNVDFLNLDMESDNFSF